MVETGYYYLYVIHDIDD